MFASNVLHWQGGDPQRGELSFTWKHLFVDDMVDDILLLEEPLADHMGKARDGQCTEVSGTSVFKKCHRTATVGPELSGRKEEG